MKNRGILFYDPIRIDLTLLEGRNLNLPMYQRNLKLFRGVDNTIEFTILDSDRQPYTTFDNNMVCIITDPYQNNLVATKYLFDTDPTNGIYSLTLCSGEIQNWSAGWYNFSVVLYGNNSEQILYTTLDQEVVGTFQLVNQPYPVQVPSALVTWTDWVMVSYNNEVSPVTTDFISTKIFPGDGQKNINDSLTTFSVNLNSFTGTLWVQASLEIQPLRDTDWFNLFVDPSNPTNNFINYDNETGILAYQFSGNYVWIRFKYEVNSLNAGQIERIWLKI